MSTRTTPDDRGTPSLFAPGDRVVICIPARQGMRAVVARVSRRRPWTREFYWLIDTDDDDLGWYESHEIERENDV